MTSGPDWQAIQKDYEHGLSLRALSAKYGVSKSAIGKRKYQEKWTEPKRAKVDTRTPTQDTGPRTRDVSAAVRVHDAINLYLEERPTWEEIARRVGYSSRGAAHSAVMRELERCITHDVKDLRNEELYMIGQIQARAFREATDPGDEAWTWKADRYIALSKRKSEIMGLDVKPDELIANQNYIKKIVLTHLPPSTEGGQDASPNG